MARGSIIETFLCRSFLLLSATTFLLFVHFLLTQEKYSRTALVIKEPSNYSTGRSVRPTTGNQAQLTKFEVKAGGNTTTKISKNERLLRKIKLADYKPLHEPRYSALNTSSKAPFCTVPAVLPQELESRRERAREMCTRLGKELQEKRWIMNSWRSSGIFSKLRWDRHHHLLYCELPKVASTTWTWHLLRAAGVKDSLISSYSNPHFLLKKRVPPPRPLDHEIGFLDDALKFLVTRHPFHRLVSAYKNKIVEAHKLRSHYVQLRQDILKRYHFPEETSLTVPTFRDFCHYVADTLEAWFLNPVNSPRPDQHWMPMTHICSPCILNYDIFCKLETMYSDTRFIADQCGLSQKINASMIINSSIKEANGKPIQSSVNEMPSQHETKPTLSGFILQKIQHERGYEQISDSYDKNVKLPKNDANISFLNTRRDEEKTKLLLQKSNTEYLSELSQEQLHRLYNVYKYDFEIFGYSLHEYK